MIPRRLIDMPDFLESLGRLHGTWRTRFCIFRIYYFVYECWESEDFRNKYHYEMIWNIKDGRLGDTDDLYIE